MLSYHFPINLRYLACRTSLLFLILLLFVFLASPVQGAQVTLEWATPTHATNIDGYRIYYGTESGNYTELLEVPGASSNNATVDGLELGTTYYFAATSYNATQESGYSREIDYTPTTSGPSSGNSGRGCVYNPNAGQGVTWLLLLLPLLLLRGIRSFQGNWGGDRTRS